MLSRSTRTLLTSSSSLPTLSSSRSPSTSTSTHTHVHTCTSPSLSRSINSWAPDVATVMEAARNPITPTPTTTTPGEPITTPTGYVLSKKASSKLLQRRATSFYMDAVELARTRYPWMVTGVRQARPKIPIELRKPGPEYLMKQLRAEECSRIQKEYPRVIEKFHTGDKIAVVKKISLHAPKYDIITGTVISTWGGQGLSSSFTVRNYHEGHGYEISYPINSPFIQRIVVLEKGNVRQKKIFEIRDHAKESVMVKPVTLEYLDKIHELRAQIATKKATAKALDQAYHQQQNAAELDRLQKELREKLAPWASEHDMAVSDIPFAPLPTKRGSGKPIQSVKQVLKASKAAATTTANTPKTPTQSPATS